MGMRILQLTGSYVDKALGGSWYWFAEGSEKSAECSGW